MIKRYLIFRDFPVVLRIAANVARVHLASVSVLRRDLADSFIHFFASTASRERRASTIYRQ